MRSTRNYISLFLLLALMSCSSSNDKLYEQLETQLAQRQAKTKAKEEHLEALKRKLHACRDKNRQYALCDSLVEQYLLFNSDSAEKYIGKAMVAAQELGNLAYINKIRMLDAYILATSGHYSEAKQMMESVGKWLVVGLIVAGLITIFVPDSYFEIFKDNSFTSMLLVLCISIPMYLCATGSIPIAVALMMKGLTPGAALVLLMAGPACSVASVLVVSKVLGRRTLTAYLGSIISGAIGFGLVTDYLLPRAWFMSHLVANDACCEEESSLFATSCTILLFLLLANAFIRRRFCSKANINSKNTMKQTFVIKGMSCNHCRMSAEKAILSVKGVTSASVDLGSKQAVVEGDFSPEDVCKAVEETGFSCSLL